MGRRCGLHGGHVAAEEAAEADGDPAAAPLPAARGAGGGELDRMQSGAAAVDGDGAHEHGIAEAAERCGCAVDEMNGSDALRDEVLDEISVQDQRWTYVVQRFVIELREQVEMIAGAHTGHD